MKNYLSAAAVLLANLCLCTTAAAQNEPPALENVSVRVDKANHKILVSYDLADREEDELEVTLKVSGDNGRTYLPDAGQASGDVGYPVKTGKAKTISWTYAGAEPPPGCRIKLIADDRYKISIADLIREVDSTNLRANLVFMTGVRNHQKEGLRHLNVVRDTIENAFRAHGLLAYRQDTVIGENQLKEAVGKMFKITVSPSKKDNVFSMQNIIGELPGQHDANTYLLTAHYDAAENSPGADDNASGVAGMMEAARVLSKYHFRHAIKFIGFDLEEKGFYGSWLYLLDGIKPHETIAGVINYDMISYYSEAPDSQIIPEGFEIIFPEVCKSVIRDGKRGNFVVNTSNRASEGLGKHFTGSASAYVPALKVMPLVAHDNGGFTPALANSDHAPFWYRKYPAIHIGDGGETRNVNLNTRKDKLSGNFNYTFMSNIVKATVATLAELAQIQHCTVAEAVLQ